MSNIPPQFGFNQPRVSPLRILSKKLIPNCCLRLVTAYIHEEVVGVLPVAYWGVLV
jgi:hypothetical protein